MRGQFLFQAPMSRLVAQVIQLQMDNHEGVKRHPARQ
jgi:hypothetical protein